jgi:hypothetical protein
MCDEIRKMKACVVEEHRTDNWRQGTSKQQAHSPANLWMGADTGPWFSGYLNSC